MSSTRYTLAADVGGTKTLFELGLAENGRYRRLHAANFLNADYAGVEQVTEAFLATVPERPNAIASACFALAGPIVGRRVRLTNLPWEVDSAALGDKLGIAQVRFVNDFAAVGHGIPSLQADELSCLQAGRADPHGVRGVLGAGTGLGMVLMVWTGNAYRVVPSEGGNADFAPVNEVQNRLWNYLSHRLERVWCGALLSGRGLERIYQFLSEADTLRARTSGGRAQESALTAAEITARAVEASDPRAVSTLNLFLEIYGAVAGNLALTLMAHGGIYIAGGIAPRIAALFAEGSFVRAFRAKGKFADLMQTFPLHVVLTPEVGLRGAVAIASHAALRRR
ncbi:MAG: glucokinase [Burkholderiales bacterium]|nr:glucokinase [Burkholderiales bacterium]